MNDREPCPLCGRQPEVWDMTQRHFCGHENWTMAEISGPKDDLHGTRWDSMCRTIRARALADVRAKVADLVPMTMAEARALGKPESEGATEDQVAAVERCIEKMLELMEDGK